MGEADIIDVTCAQALFEIATGAALVVTVFIPEVRAHDNMHSRMRGPLDLLIAECANHPPARRRGRGAVGTRRVASCRGGVFWGLQRRRGPAVGAVRRLHGDERVL